MDDAATLAVLIVFLIALPIVLLVTGVIDHAERKRAERGSEKRWATVDAMLERREKEAEKAMNMEMDMSWLSKLNSEYGNW